MVYELCYPWGEPFYVGKGTPTRPYDHEKNARKGHKSYLCSVIRELWRDGLYFDVAIVFETDDEKEAFAEEIRLIAQHRKNGLRLANVANGGGGVVGESISRTLKGRRHLKQHNENVSRSLKGTKFSPERLEQHRRTMASPERRRKSSESAKKRYEDPAEREKTAAANRGKAFSEGRCANISHSLTGRKLSDEHRKNIGYGQTGKTISQEHIDALSKGRREKESDRKNWEARRQKYGPSGRKPKEKVDG